MISGRNESLVSKIIEKLSSMILIENWHDTWCPFNVKNELLVQNLNSLFTNNKILYFMNFLYQNELEVCYDIDLSMLSNLMFDIIKIQGWLISRKEAISQLF